MTSLLASATHSSLTHDKLSAVRALMREHQLDGYLIPSADEHLNEYVPEAKQRRAWASGFTGSVGDFLVGCEQAWVFVDSRYYEQADLEVDTDQIQVCKLELEGHKNLVETLEALGKESQSGFRLGFDPFTLQIEQFRTFEKQLKLFRVEFAAIAVNLVDQVRQQPTWRQDTSPYAESPVFSVPAAITGESTDQKLKRVQESLQKSNADLLPITKLDQIAWLFNLRGLDVPYNPVFIAYAIVTTNAAYLFTNTHRLDSDAQQALAGLVTLLPYEQYPQTLKMLLTGEQLKSALLDTKQTTLGTYQLLNSALSIQIVEAANPIEKMKACKNAVELEQMQHANLKASRAKTRVLKWISDRMAADQTTTEADVAEAIAGYYAEEEGFQGLSFNTIAGTGANGSIVHYGTPSTEAVLKPGDLLLLDSGAQFWGGTTDDTRTVGLGEPTPEQIERYTEVLKAHINCAVQRFPKGTTGVQLDGITRSDLWMAGLDYGHGTGHGVGVFLNVHEGPNGISKRAHEPLEPNMINSIEPGYYESGWGGIRLENLYRVKNLSGESEPTQWYGFESLTYIPFDPTLIDLSRLDQRQRQWLEQYHATVLEKLSASLSLAEQDWLRQVCPGEISIL
jgi:Xaa-Pro aminopeptidase